VRGYDRKEMKQTQRNADTDEMTTNTKDNLHCSNLFFRPYATLLTLVASFQATADHQITRNHHTRHQYS